MVELEAEDGKLVFEVTVVDGDRIMEVEIDASDGDTLEVEEEDDDEEQRVDHTPAGISLERAIGIATGEVAGDLVEAELEVEIQN